MLRPSVSLGHQLPPYRVCCEWVLILGIHRQLPYQILTSFVHYVASLRKTKSPSEMSFFWIALRRDGLEKRKLAPVQLSLIRFFVAGNVTYKEFT